MPQSNGSGSTGYQKLFDRQPCPSRQLQILLNPQFDGQPSKVGFYYVLISDDGGYSKYVYDTGLLYLPGLLVIFPDATLLAGKNVTMWVNWDTPGINWIATT